MKPAAKQINKDLRLPPLTQEPIEHVDLTPDEDLPIRILKVYRENCNCNWATDANGNCDNPLFDLMNEHNKQRAKILDEAITILENILLRSYNKRYNIFSAPKKRPDLVINLEGDEE